MREVTFYLILCIYGGINYYSIFSVQGQEHKYVPCNTSKLCSEEKLLAFLADIEIINPESIVEWAVDTLETLCKNICMRVKKINKYLKTCDPLPEDNLYMSLIAGVTTLKDKLCWDPEFAKTYAIYYPCLHELKNDFEACDGPADWNENQDKNEMCKDYKDIIDCYYIKAAKVCGYDAATILKGLMKDVINSVVKIKCSRINRDPYVADPMPESYIKRSGACSVYKYSQILILIFWFILLMS